MRRFPLMVIIYFILFIFCVLVKADLGAAQEPPKTAGNETKEFVLHREKRRSGWGRDPFLLPPAVHLLSKGDPALAARDTPSKLDGQPKEIPPPILEVKAILISDHLRLASIDRQVVTVGDLLHDERVLDIQTDRVVLEKEGKKRSLLLTQSPVRLIIEEIKGKEEKR